MEFKYKIEFLLSCSHSQLYSGWNLKKKNKNKEIIKSFTTRNKIHWTSSLPSYLLKFLCWKSPTEENRHTHPLKINYTNVTLRNCNLNIKISIYNNQQWKAVEPYPWLMIHYLQKKYFWVLHSPDCRTFTALIYYLRTSDCNDLSHICGELKASNFQTSSLILSLIT